MFYNIITKYIDIFLLKKWEKLLQNAKASHIFQQKYWIISFYPNVTFISFGLHKVWTNGPCLLLCKQVSNIPPDKYSLQSMDP